MEQEHENKISHCVYPAFCSRVPENFRARKLTYFFNCQITIIVKSDWIFHTGSTMIHLKASFSVEQVKQINKCYRYRRIKNVWELTRCYPCFATSQAVATDKLATMSHGTKSVILLLSPKTVRKIPFPAPAMKATPPF